MTVELSKDEINLLLSGIGLALDVLYRPSGDPARLSLEALQEKLMRARDGVEHRGVFPT